MLYKRKKKQKKTKISILSKFFIQQKCSIFSSEPLKSKEKSRKAVFQSPQGIGKVSILSLFPLLFDFPLH